jgi:PAS domain-containing protein
VVGSSKFSFSYYITGFLILREAAGEVPAVYSPVKPDFLIPLRGNEDYYRAFRRQVYKQNGWDGELSGRRKDGDIFPLWLTLRFHSSQPEVIEGVKEGFYIGIITDLSVSRMLEEML